MRAFRWFAAVIVPLFLFAGCNDPFVLLQFLNGGPSLTPQNATVTTMATTLFNTSGGTPPYSYEIVSGPGSFDENTGEFTSASGGTTVIRVVDAAGSSADASTEVVATSATGIWISPTTIIVDQDEEIQFNGGGGDGSYTYSISWGAGSIDPQSGLFTASPFVSGVGTGIIRITDGALNFAIASVVIKNESEGFSVLPTATVVYLGDDITFTASGATGFVVWNASSVPSVPAMPFPGDSSVYTPSAVGYSLVVATDVSLPPAQVTRPVIVIAP